MIMVRIYLCPNLLSNHFFSGFENNANQVGVQDGIPIGDKKKKASKQNEVIFFFFLLVGQNEPILSLEKGIFWMVTERMSFVLI